MQNRSYLQRNHLLHIVLVLAFCLGVGFCLTSSPAAAFAKSYTMPEVQIEANADSAGDLSVSEDRTFDFDGSFTAVWWNFNNLPSGAGIEIESVEVTAGGKTTTLSSVPSKQVGEVLAAPAKRLTHLTAPKMPFMCSTTSTMKKPRSPSTIVC